MLKFCIENTMDIRPPRIELGASAWKADMLPLHHGRPIYNAKTKFEFKRI